MQMCFSVIYCNNDNNKYKMSNAKMIPHSKQETVNKSIMHQLIYVFNKAYQICTGLDRNLPRL